MAKIQITNLRLRTIIGIFDWEREEKQDIVINLTIHFDASKSCKSDDIKDTVDYKTITKAIIQRVESSQFKLLEALADMILQTVFETDLVEKVSVKIDKPGALRFSDSVSVELEKDRHE